jgi:carboxymethylenebutenolidase
MRGSTPDAAVVTGAGTTAGAAHAAHTAAAAATAHLFANRMSRSVSRPPRAALDRAAGDAHVRAMPTTMIELSTKDGPCKMEVVTPDGAGPWPAVIEFYDAAGLRPAQTKVAERIAKMGYVVLQPDLFHRSAPLSSLIPGEITLGALSKVFGDADLRTKFMQGWYMPALAYENLTTTIGAVLDHAATRKDVKHGIGVGTTGYCMGGNASFRSATIFGDRIAACASFHPGGLVTDQADSPHTRAATIKSRVYVGPATGDLPPDAEAKLRAALDGAHVKFAIEHYDANHGYAISDSPSYNEPACEKHYAALEKLYRETLRA